MILSLSNGFVIFFWVNLNYLQLFLSSHHVVSINLHKRKKGVEQNLRIWVSFVVFSSLWMYVLFFLLSFIGFLEKKRLHEGFSLPKPLVKLVDHLRSLRVECLSLLINNVKSLNHLIVVDGVLLLFSLVSFSLMLFYCYSLLYFSLSNSLL